MLLFKEYTKRIFSLNAVPDFRRFTVLRGWIRIWRRPLMAYIPKI
jgi:hypothetical protein